MKRILLVACLGLWACGEKEPEAPQCQSFASADFDKNSGWDSASYCDAATDLGCYPFHGQSADVCGPFTTMRTAETGAASAAGCESLLTQLNCGTYASDDGTTTLSFHVTSADRFTARVNGTYNGVAVDTTFYFNPCHQNCQAAITLDTLDADQQKICDIPSREPACLFPPTAHSLTFVRADGGSVVIRTAGNETALARVVDEE